MKRFVALVLSTFVLFAAGLVSFAAPVHSNSPAQWHATAVLTNTDTGEKSFVPINLAESSIKKLAIPHNVLLKKQQYTLRFLMARFNLVIRIHLFPKQMLRQPLKSLIIVLVIKYK